MPKRNPRAPADTRPSGAYLTDSLEYCQRRAAEMRRSGRYRRVRLLRHGQPAGMAQVFAVEADQPFSGCAGWPIDWLVSYQCPVWYTDLAVIREFWRRGLGRAARDVRRRVIAAAVESHHRHQDLCREFRL